jgi:hypothetical protein
MTRQANLILPGERREFVSRFLTAAIASEPFCDSGCSGFDAAVDPVLRSLIWKSQLATPGGLVVKIAVKIATHSDAAALRSHQLL